MNRNKLLLLFFVIVVSASYWHFVRNQATTTSQQQTYAAHTFSSIIVESNTIKDVLNYTKNDQTLVIFDLDNTLVYPKKDVGGDAWFSYQMKQKISTGMSYEDALAVVLPLFFNVQDSLTLYPVETETPNILNFLEKQGIIALGLTARSLPLIARTHVQLKEAGLRLTKSPIFDRELSFNFNKPAVLNHGIMFCNNVNKGTVLINVLRTCDFKPTTIVYVDDKLSHLLEVQKECLDNNIHFIGLRYGKLDEFVSRFDPLRAEQQLAELLGPSATSGVPAVAPAVGA